MKEALIRKNLKRIIGVLVFIFLLLFFVPKIGDIKIIGEANAGFITPDGMFEYTVNNEKSVTITRYAGTKEDVTIPGKIDGKVVGKIDSKAFYKNNYIKSLNIEKRSESYR